MTEILLWMQVFLDGKLKNLSQIDEKKKETVVTTCFMLSYLNING